MKEIVSNVLIDTDYCTLSIDGSSDRTESVVHVAALTPAPLLLAQYRHGTEIEGADTLFTDLEEAKRMCDDLECMVGAIMQDNCRTATATGNLVREKMKIGAPGCTSHADSLLKNDMLQDDDDIVKKAKRLQLRLKKSKLGSFVRDYIIEEEIKKKLNELYPNKTIDDEEYRTAFFKKKETWNKRIGTKGESGTRAWNSTLNILDELLKRKHHIKRLTDSTEKSKTNKYLKAKDVNFEEWINDETFWNDIETVNDKMKHIKRAMNISQSDLFSLSDAFQQYDELLQAYDDYQDEIVDRWDLICDDIHAAAWFCDPRYVKEEFDTEYKQRAEAYYVQLFGDLWNESVREQWVEFRNGEGPFKDMPDLTVKQKKFNMKHSVSYWKEFKRNKKYGTGAKMFAMLCGLAGTNGGMERTFNFVRRIHTPARGALGPRTVDKLVYVSCNYSFIKDKVLDFYGVPRGSSNEYDAINEAIDVETMLQELELLDDDGNIDFDLM